MYLQELAREWHPKEKVDGGAAATADTDADTTAFRGDSSPIQPGQIGDKAISIVATDSPEPPKKTESTRTVRLPDANPVAFTYDLNGNMLTDGQWTYTWNDENRMVSAEEDPNVGGGSSRRLLFTYDGQGRRRTKKVHSWDPQTADWLLTTTHLFLYDGWNLIHEITSDHTQAPAEETASSYVWGLDLSQTLQGAGGVGGLLSITRHLTPDTCHFVAYDGNGNVVALVDSSDATVTAEYDYSPFGTTVKASGPAAAGNVWRFSTKYHDTETGLVYYGYRYYNPQLGRWVNRDPVGEAGGAALYAFAANAPVGLWDMLGCATHAQFVAIHEALRKAIGQCDQNKCGAMAAMLRDWAGRYATAIGLNDRRVLHMLAEGGSKLSDIKKEMAKHVTDDAKWKFLLKKLGDTALALKGETVAQRLGAFEKVVKKFTAAAAAGDEVAEGDHIGALLSIGKSFGNKVAPGFAAYVGFAGTVYENSLEAIDGLKWENTVVNWIETWGDDCQQGINPMLVDVDRVRRFGERWVPK